MNNKFKNGSIKISNDIFYMILSRATQEVDGVKSIVGLTHDIEKVNSKNSKKAMEIIFNKMGITATIRVSVEYGTKLNEISKKIQENVKNKIEAMTGIKVLGVDIIIESIEK